MQKYKVFYNNKFLLISNNKTSCKNCKIAFLYSQEFIENFINDNNSEDFQIICDNPKETFHRLMQDFKYIEAAGGLIENDKQEILLIYRLEHWDLPKGKIEKDELPYETAVREVQEECGIKIEKAGEQISSTFHIYKMKDKLYLKKTFWYKMYYRGNETPIPQTEEDIQKVIWVNKTEIPQYSEKMFEGIKELFKEYFSMPS